MYVMLELDWVKTVRISGGLFLYMWISLLSLVYNAWKCHVMLVWDELSPTFLLLDNRDKVQYNSYQVVMYE